MLERDNIGIFGKVNAGKSTLMNLLTQQETSLVDPTPGTTADTKITVMEIHGIGPVRLFDTAGLDEVGKLGEKKRKKTSANLKEADLVLLVVDPDSKEFTVEKKIIESARDLDKQILIIFNRFRDDADTKTAESKISLSSFYPKLMLDLSKMSSKDRVINFILDNFESKQKKIDLLPFLEEDEVYVLNIPMDVETPKGRFLRPQSKVVEHMTRNWTYPLCYRMDLGKARNKNTETSGHEKKRYLAMLDIFKKRPKVVITDSQAIDIIHPWTPDDIQVTTFSITMINHVSSGKLGLFVKGIEALKNLKKGDKVLIVEACNHSRIGEDIGTIQIPRYLETKFPKIIIEHNFGREFQENENLKDYSLIIHCGGCMITHQKLGARIRDLERIGIPFTNYGVFLSYIQGEDVLERVLTPWGIRYKP